MIFLAFILRLVFTSLSPKLSNSRRERRFLPNCRAELAPTILLTPSHRQGLQRRGMVPVYFFSINKGRSDSESGMTNGSRVRTLGLAPCARPVLAQTGCPANPQTPKYPANPLSTFSVHLLTGRVFSGKTWRPKALHAAEGEASPPHREALSV